MKYLEYKIFNEKYPIGDLLSEGGSESRNIFNGKNGKYIVKENTKFNNYLTEVNFYCSFDHPCIAKIDVISFNSSRNEVKYYFKMEKGEDIIEAYLSNKIKLNEIASDVLSALDYLHKKGIGHFDIKDMNIIYLNEKATLIDFGFTARCQPFIYNQKKDFFCNDVWGYTPLFNDPQFFEYQYDSIKTDLYAFGVMLYDLYRIKIDKVRDPWKERDTNPYPNLKNIRDGNLRNFISECMKPWNIRKSTEDLLKHPLITRKYEIDNYIPWIFPSGFYSSEICSKFNDVSYETCKMMIKENFYTKESFDVIHDLHICLDILNPTYDPNKSKKIAYIIMYMVDSIIPYGSHEMKLSNINKYVEIDGKYDKIELLFTTLDVLNGQISHTTYYSLSPEEYKYPILFEDTLKCSYNPNYIRTDFRNINYVRENYDMFKTIFPLINFQRVSLDQKVSSILSNYQYIKLPGISISQYEEAISNVMKINDPEKEDYNVIMNYMELLPKIDRKLYSSFNIYMSKTPRRRAILDMINQTLKQL